MTNHEKLRPLDDRLMIQPDEKTDKHLPSGLIIPESATDNPMTATVLAVGRKVEEVKTGDRILYAQYAGAKITSNKKDTPLMIREADVYGVFEGDE